MLWYNSPETIDAIRESQHETTDSGTRLMRLVRGMGSADRV
jgi:hypothetical protein